MSSSPPAPKPLGNHNRCWIWGRHAVWTTLAAGRWTPLEVAITPRCPDELRTDVRRIARSGQIPLVEITDAELTKRTRADDHQGLAARMPEFPYATLTELLSRTPSPTAWLVLDGLQDSFNFGAIIRSAVELGIDAILIGTAGQSGVNSQVVRSSAGAVNYLPIVRVRSLSAALDDLCSAGVVPLAASEKSAMLLETVDLTRPVALVIGNEGQGVSHDVMSRCLEQVRIPIENRVGSLNAAVAAGILCYELVRQRNQKQRRS
ncbi:MAG: RNA methyltransferase [Planctomycetaceae bacterium]|nr:RNA methyltransferase [Planctomycetaceae bacterium]